MIMIQIKLVQPGRATAAPSSNLETDEIKKLLEDAKKAEEEKKNQPPKDGPVPVESPDAKDKDAKEKAAKDDETKGKDAKDKKSS